MTYPTADLVRMKLRNHPFSVEPAKPRIFEESEYEHPWYKHAKDSTQLNKPKPPSEEAVKKAQFKDKTYEWRPNARR
tara:strand:- start:814 stop:1044 length:231 start_codon:yes stop_codon:yes gene_type:complete